MRNIKHIHFIGIGGVGMSGIAEVMKGLCYTVSGSDLKSSKITKKLSDLGVIVYNSHSIDNIKGVDLIVYSSAINHDNVEYQAAKELKLPLVPRAQMLAEIMRFKKGIAVSGTHGKTTTTSIIAKILSDSGYDPTYVIGGIIRSSSTNAKLGQGDYFVAEADESDRSFLLLNPMFVLITNIDHDHLNAYEQNFNNLVKAFIDFANSVPFYGLVVACADCPRVRAILSDINREVKTYGFNSGCDYQIVNYQQSGMHSYFEIKHNNQLFPVNTPLAGKHNALNITASFALATDLQVEPKKCLQAINDFTGTNRRLQALGSFYNSSSELKVYDDYGHHPSELAVVINTLKAAYPNEKIRMLFQPHRYSRTNELMSDFVTVLSELDEIYLLEIYSAGEENTYQISSKHIIEQINNQSNHNKAKYVAENELDLRAMVNELSGIFIIQGAGSVSKISSSIKQILQEEHITYA